MSRDKADEFEMFVLDCQQKAFLAAYRILGNVHDARDAVQEAFMKAFKSRGDFRGDAAVTTWFHRIVVNASLDLMRRRSIRRTVDEMPPDRADNSRPGPEENAGINETRQIVRSAVDGLPERQRDVFLLRHFEGLSVREIGGTLGIAEGTVKIHLFRAVHSLKEDLSGYDL